MQGSLLIGLDVIAVTLCETEEEDQPAALATRFLRRNPPSLASMRPLSISRTAAQRALSVSFSLFAQRANGRSEEHTSELQSLMRISYAVFCLKKKNINN